MSNIAFRDSSVAVLETSRTKISAIIGVHDLLRPPIVVIPACVGLRRSTRANGTSEDANGASSSNKLLSNVRVDEYLVGQQLDDALAAGEDVVVSWPFMEGDIKDFTGAEALWKHVLFNRLGLKRTLNESPILLSLPHTLSRDSNERICQIFFERFNSAAVSILERPLAQLYATNTLTGLVVDIGDNTTDISPISDCLIQHNCCESIPIGISDCEKYLASLLKANQGVIDALSPPSEPLEPSALQEALLALAQHIWKEGLIKISESDASADAEEEGVTNIAAVLVAGKEKAVIESGMKKRANAKASAAEQARAKEIEALDLVTTEFRENEITLGRERHRFLEPLFEPSVLQGVEGVEEKVWHGSHPLSIQDVIGRAVGRTDLASRIAIWDGFFVTGDCTSLVKGIGLAIQARLTPYLLGNPDLQNDVQPKAVRVLHVPEYFAEYREKGDGLAAFLGATVVAKVIFADPHGKNFISKADYTSKGPRAVLEMSPSLL